MKPEKEEKKNKKRKDPKQNEWNNLLSAFAFKSKTEFQIRN